MPIRKNDGKPTLNLAQRGFLLLSLPLILQLLVVAALFRLYNQAEEQAQIGMRARDISEATAGVLKEAYRIIRGGFDSIDNGTAPSFDQEKIEDSFKRLSVLVQGDEEAEATVAEASAAEKRIVEIMERTLKEQQENSSKPDAPGHQMRQNELLASLGKDAHLIEKLVALEKEHKRIFSESPEQQSTYRHQAQSILLAAVVADVVLFVAMSFLFSRHVVQGLGVILDNSFRFARGTALRAPIGGSDEISQLDGSFHHMAAAVTDATRQRHEVMQMVSHDLRSPLSTLLSFHDMLEANMLGQLNPQGIKMLSVANRTTMRMLSLVNDLLDMEKAESGKLTLTLADVQLTSVFEETLQSTHGLAVDRHVLVEVEPSQAVVYADSQRLVQVLVNLVSNAIKASPEGSLVELRATVSGGAARLQVSDQGPGIAADLIPKLFDRFEQGDLIEKQDRMSSGLGLAICKVLVDLHGGSIEVESALGQGSTFTVVLPQISQEKLGELAESSPNPLLHDV